MTALALCATLLAASPAETLHSIIDRDWAFRVRDSPLFATMIGDHGADDQLDAADEAAHQRRLAHAREVAQELAQVPRDQLGPVDRVSAAVLAEEARAHAADGELRTYLMPVNGDSSFFSYLPQLARGHLFRNAADYRKYLSRLRQIPRFFDQHLVLMREGLKIGMTAPQIILQGRDSSARAVADMKDVRKSEFYSPFITMPASMPAAEAEQLRAEAQAVIKESVQPAYAKVAAFLAETYIPGARTTIAAADLPDGRVRYQAAVREFVTRDVTPEQVHETGLREVARIRAEMEAIKKVMGFAGELQAFFTHLRTAPEYYAKTPEELLMRAAYIAKTIDGKLPAYFGRLPRLPYTVEPVPDSIAPYYTGGRYVGAAEGSSAPGIFWVNTYDLKSRPLYVLPSLALHEAVPGHHLQISLAAEQKDLPLFRRYAYFSVYGEGWGLYSEKLGEEMGIYRTPAEHFGRLTYEMWRACRLVVDTGMHALGWPREKALAFMRDNTALSLHEIETEIDRYIGWPGQALSYKMGELTIRALRAKAEKSLGEKFDIKSFHDAILALGSVPLPVLEDEVDRYIAAHH